MKALDNLEALTAKIMTIVNVGHGEVQLNIINLFHCSSIRNTGARTSGMKRPQTRPQLGPRHTRLLWSNILQSRAQVSTFF